MLNKESSIFPLLVPSLYGEEIVGTAFCLDIYDPKNPSSSFFITAAHCLSEAIRTNKQILIRLSNGTERPIEPVLFPESYSDLPDISILHSRFLSQVNPLILSEFGAPITASAPIAVTLEGAAQGLKTKFTTFGCEVRGLDELKESGRKVLSIFSDEIAHATQIRASPAEGKGAHDIISGMSGGPLIQSDDDSSVIGVFISIEEEGAAGRGYAVPVTQIIAAARTRGLVLQYRQSAIPINSNQEVLHTIIQDLDDPRKEVYAWNNISNLFFKRQPIVRWVLEIAKEHSDYNLSPFDRAMVYYFLGRLALKSGTAERALEYFNQCRQFADQTDNPSRARILDLVKTRVLAQAAKNKVYGGDEAFELFYHARNIIERMPTVGAEYKKKEIASLINQESSRILSNLQKCGGQAKAHLLSIADEHSRIFREDRVGFQRQNVVATFLEALLLAWGLIHNQDQAGRLIHLSERGLFESWRNRNSIFPLQALLIRSLGEEQSGNVATSSALVAFVGSQMRKQQIGFLHEGIQQLLYFLEFSNPRNANVLDVAYNLPLNSGPDLIRSAIGTEHGASITMNKAVDHYYSLEEQVQELENFYEIGKGGVGEL